MDEWRSATVGDLATLQRGIDLPQSSRRPGNVPVMGSFGITGRHDQAACSGPGVTVGRSGASIGVVSYIDEDYWPLNTCLYVRDFHGNNPRFTYYALQTMNLSRLNSGSAQPSLNRNFVHPVPISIPPRSEQDAIASILGALDDKIEQNHRMNETLLEIAQAIFRDWFIYFGPTRAKMAAHERYLLPAIWKLFPQHLDVGGAPMGWANVTFAELTSLRRERVGTREAVVLSAIASGVLARSDDHFSKRVYSKEIANYLAVNKYDFAYNPSRINIGSIGMLEEDILGAVSPVYVVVRPKPRFQWFIEFMLRMASTKAWINSLASGSVRQALAYKEFASIPCVLPPLELLTEFNALWESLRDRIIANERESRSVAVTRDLLLSSLMSGAICIRNAEKTAEAAA